MVVPTKKHNRCPVGKKSLDSVEVVNGACDMPAALHEPHVTLERPALERELHVELERPLQIDGERNARTRIMLAVAKS